MVSGTAGKPKQCLEITMASLKATISDIIRKIIQMAVQNQSQSH